MWQALQEAPQMWKEPSSPSLSRFVWRAMYLCCVYDERWRPDHPNLFRWRRRISCTFHSASGLQTHLRGKRSWLVSICLPKMLHYDLVSPNRLWPHYRIFLGTNWCYSCQNCYASPGSMTELNWWGLVGYSLAAPIQSFRDSKRRSLVRVENKVKKDSIGTTERLIWKLTILPSLAPEPNYIFVLDQNVFVKCESYTDQFVK